MLGVLGGRESHIKPLQRQNFTHAKTGINHEKGDVV